MKSYKSIHDKLWWTYSLDVNRKLSHFGFKNPIGINHKTGDENMTTLKESAQEYESKQTKNISDLKTVNTELDLQVREYTDKNGDIFKVQVIVVDGVDYRVPASVIKNLKSVIEAKPEMTEFMVKKKGTGMATTYTVIPLD